MNAVPIDWLKRLRDNAARYGYRDQSVMLDLIIRKWENEREQEDINDEFGTRLLGTGTADR